MTAPLLLQALLVAGLALVHALIGRLRFLHGTPRTLWLSGAGGVAVAYVFVHVLPELAAASAAIAASSGPFAALERHAYLVALTGLVLFYGLERMVKCSQRARGPSPATPRESTTSPQVFRLHISSFAAYNLLVGYLLAHRDAPGLWAFFTAMALHFVVIDFGLLQDHLRAYERTGRWLLILALAGGWLLGLAVELGTGATGLLFALLAGGTILNVLKEELPEERESRFLPFALGAALYAALLLQA